VPIFVPTLLPAELAGAIARTRGDSALAEEMAKAILAIGFAVPIPFTQPWP